MCRKPRKFAGENGADDAHEGDTSNNGESNGSGEEDLVGAVSDSAGRRVGMMQPGLGREEFWGRRQQRPGRSAVYAYLLWRTGQPQAKQWERGRE